MAQEEISDEIRRFILKSIISVPYLEALLLFRDNSSHLWNVETLAKRLYIGYAATDALIAQLKESGFIEEAGGTERSYRYAPQTSEQRDIVDQLAQTYARNLIGVTNLIHSRSGTTAQQFADAFLFRKDA